jgi:glutamate dehydrogenase
MAADAAAVNSKEGAKLLRWFHDGAMTLLAHENWRTDGTGQRPARPVPLHARHADPGRGVAQGRGRLFPQGRRGAAAAQVQFDLDRASPRAARHRRRADPDRRRSHRPVDPCRPVDQRRLFAAPEDVPVLRARLNALEDKFGFDPKGHTGKAMTHALTALPHDLTTAFDPPRSRISSSPRCRSPIGRARSWCW